MCRRVSFPITFWVVSRWLICSPVLWDVQNNQETDLPDMPGGVVRVYPGSGGVAMLPLTPQNNYVPTILFCGGNAMPADDWGNYSYPAVDTWNVPASADCQRITPEPADGSSPVYVQDDGMLETRTMGQFIILPDGKLLMVNGGNNGTAGYSDQTNTTPKGGNPFIWSLASGPVGQPALYDPNAKAGSRWSNQGFSTSSIPRLYHSSAILLPDASVMIAGSNPNVDVNLTAMFPTTYKIEIFYPSYFSATTRPQPSGIPSSLSYGGSSFDITLPASSYSGSANDAADSVIIAVIRPGWTTHGMNMGQRFLQLNNTYTVNNDGSIVFHTAQMPPNSNIFQPGPAYVFVTVNGVPSNGTYVIVGNGQMGTQPTSAASSLPASVRLDSAKGSADGSTTGTGSNNSSDGSSNNSGSMGTGKVIGAVVAGIVVVGIVGALIGIYLARRRRAAARARATAAHASFGPNGNGRTMMKGGYENVMMTDTSHSGAGMSYNDQSGMGMPSSPYLGGAGIGLGATSALGAGHESRTELMGASPVREGFGPTASSPMMMSPSQDRFGEGPGLTAGSPTRGEFRSPSPYYRDHSARASMDDRASGMGMSMEFDPYSSDPRRVGTPTRY
jgi:hypothetical protein